MLVILFFPFENRPDRLGELGTGLLFLRCCLVTAKPRANTTHILPLQRALLLRNGESLMLASSRALWANSVSSKHQRGLCQAVRKARGSRMEETQQHIK